MARHALPQRQLWSRLEKHSEKLSAEIQRQTEARAVGWLDMHPVTRADMSNLTSEEQAEQKHAARAKRRYVRLTLAGTKSSFVAEPHEAEYMRKEDPDLVASDVWMTVAEFEALPDFGGF